MKQTLIKITDDHYVIVDDSEIKEGDWVVGCTRTVVQCMYPENVHHRDVKKITHSTQPLELIDWENGAVGKRPAFDKIKPLPLSEVKELIGEVDVDKKADDIIPNLLHKKYVKTGFIAGYNQALEDNKKRKYTEEDLRMAYKEGAKSQRFNAHLDGSEKTIVETIQSLQPKTQWEVTFDEQGKLRLL